MRFSLFILLFYFMFPFCYSLFEDQIGKFDWSAKHLGCFDDVVFDTTENGGEVLLATSKKHAIGRINTNTGDLDWRQLNEHNVMHNPRLLVKDSRAVVLYNNGEYVRVFDVDSGLLKWQHMLGLNTTRTVKFALSSKVLAVLDASTIYGILGKEKLKSKWKASIDQDSRWTHVAVLGESIFAMGALKNGKEIRILKLDHKTGAVEKLSRLVINDSTFTIDSCIVSGHFLVCLSGASLFTLNFISTSTDGLLHRVDTNMGASILELNSLNVASGPSAYFVVQSGESTIVSTVVPTDGTVKRVLKLDRSKVFTLARNVQPHDSRYSGAYKSSGNIAEDIDPSSYSDDSNYLFSIYYGAQRLLKVYDLKKKSISFVSFRINTNNSLHDNFTPTVGGGALVSNEAPVKSVHVVGASESGAFQILTIRYDCRVDFYEAHTNQDKGTDSTDAKIVDATLEWVRFEALASISGVEMIDLPLSESQAQIETEFGAENDNLWRTFFLRVTSQMEQLQRTFVAFSNRLSESMALLTSRRGGASPIVVLRHLFGYDQRRAHRQRSATIPIKEEQLSSRKNLERDYFNLRKLIIVSTLTGSIYAISNENGEVIWSLYLGENMAPFVSQLGRPIVPLFIQRGTALFQYISQAAVVFNSKHSKKSNVFIFNPITGAHVTTFFVENLKRVELMPFADEESLRRLILVDETELVRFYPEISNADFRPPRPIYLMFMESVGGLMRGTIIDFDERKLVDVWKNRLGFVSPDERIVATAAKPQIQRVHSQGKVLGDRSVLYKYANPNLIAIASVDELHSSMGIWLVDGVSGQVVHAARYSHAFPPVYLVHCENWLIYSYWNEKARRTEMGIIELYEGLEQTNVKNFNSFTALKQPLVVFAQSYVFPQGVSAMAASETEQGLSSRSLIVAMPFGGVLEMSRRFLDARRPLEMTPELREEMIIPYIPELPVTTEDLINYNRTVHNVHAIKTFASGLESTSLVFVYGLDIFYTRVTPSGTFDILKDDFDYLLISLVMIVLIVASVLSKRLWRYNNLKQAWA